MAFLKSSLTPPPPSIPTKAEFRKGVAEAEAAAAAATERSYGTGEKEVPLPSSTVGRPELNFLRRVTDLA